MVCFFDELPYFTRKNERKFERKINTVVFKRVIMYNIKKMRILYIKRVATMKENKCVEYKEKVTNTFLKTVSAFANYNGGSIIFGVDDDGIVTGIENPDKTRLDIENRINDSISPQPDYDLEVTSANTVVLTVFAGSKKPYLYKSKAYKRNDTATIEVDTVELTRLILEGSNRRYEELPSNDQKLTFRILEEKLIAETGIESCDSNVLKTLGLYTDKEGYNNAAALLADRNTYPGVDIGKFGGSISIIQKRKTYEHMSILSVYDSACEMFRDYYQYEIIEGNVRKTKEMIPEEAFRETIANALIHRFWDVSDQIRVFMFDDKIEVYSPGGLPAGLSKEEYLSGNISRLRNPVISNVFYRLRLVEIFGTGIRRIKETYGRSVSKPEFDVYDNSIKVTLPLLESADDLDADAAIVYSTLSRESGKSISDIMKRVPFGKSKTRVILNDLISDKFVYVSGGGRGTKYHKR